MNENEKKYLAYLRGKEVRILKGLRSFDNDLMVEVSAKGETKQSVSFWKLSIASSKEASEILKKFFKLSFKEANKIHSKCRRKAHENRRLKK